MLWIVQFSPIMNADGAVNGQLDVTEVSTKKDLYPLAGEWMYYPDVLLTNEELQQNKFKDKAAAKVFPDDWLDIASSPNYQYGTFHMHLTIDDELLDESLSFHVPNTKLSSRIFVQGKEIGASGNPAANKNDFIASMSPYVATFYAQDKELDVILHVSNNGVDTKVPPINILFGTTNEINENVMMATMIKVIAFVVLAALFLISFYVYLKMKEEKSILYFSLIMLGTAFTVLLDYDRVLLLDLPVSYAFKMKLLAMIFCLNGLFMLQFFKHYLPEQSKFKLFKFLPYPTYLYMLFLIFVPIQIVLAYRFIFILVLLIPFLFFIATLFKVVRNDVTDIVLILMAALAMLNNVIWSVIKHNIDFVIFEYYPVDLIIALILFVVYWLKRYFRNNEEIKALSLQLIEKDKSKDEFLASTSHELRNPLHSIINIAQFVHDNPDNKIVKEDKENLNLLLSVGKQMSILINDLLDLTLMDENKLRLEKKPVNVHSITTVVISLMTYMIKAKNIVIHNNIPKDFPAVYADENRLIQMMTNILHNAIKYTEKGEIVVTGLVSTNNMVSIEIIDTGKGMSEEDLKEIFKPYVKGDDHDGIGLGLKVTKELVELHDGEIYASTNEQNGTTITFTLPIANENDAIDAVKLAKAETAATTNLSDMAETKLHTNKENVNLAESTWPKLLLIDDDQVNNKIITNVLSTENYHIYSVNSGEEALEKINSTKFDLVICDIMMPGMSGYELTRQIREQFNLSELPILLLTARGRTEDLHFGFQVGANDYLIKPVDPIELKARVRLLADLQLTINNQLKMEAAWLRAQINPHFLYNTINSILMMMHSNPERMQYLLKNFVYFLRTSFDFQNTDHLVLLNEELQLIESYLAIEKERFGDRIQVKWLIDDSLDILIPPLSLQTLVENALKHGILNRIDGGTITIKSIEEEEYVDIIIEDDGAGIPKHIIEMMDQQQFDREKGIGLVNTDKRLRRFLGTKLTIKSEMNQGTIITIRIKV